jgi:hypothetical protein
VSWRIWIWCLRQPVQSRQPTPPPNYEQAVREPVVPQPRSEATFTPIRLPPGQGMYAQAYRQERARSEAMLDNQREVRRAQANRIANLEAELEQLRGQRANAEQTAAVCHTRHDVHERHDNSARHANNERPSEERRQRREREMCRDRFLQDTLARINRRNANHRANIDVRPNVTERDMNRMSTAADRAAERAAIEEMAEAERRRQARQYARDFSARPPSLQDGCHLDAHITEDCLTGRPRQTLDQTYSYERRNRNMNRERAFAQILMHSHIQNVERQPEPT